MVATVRDHVNMAVCMYAGAKHARVCKSSVVKRSKEAPQRRRVFAEVSNLLQPWSGGMPIPSIAARTG